MTDPTPPAYCVAGHHRSGSSLVSAMLQSAGVDIGRRLMAGAESNPRGHFEDLDFYEFHVGVLAGRGLRGDGFVTDPDIPVPADAAPAADALVAARRSAGRPWAWKEPRTTLFLDFWRGRAPELGFVLLFRPPWDVVDSLFRRGDAVYRADPGLAVPVLENYNRRVIDFHDRHPDRCVVVDGVAAAADPARFAAVLAARFGRPLALDPAVYEPALIRWDTPAPLRSLFVATYPAAVEQYRQLRARAALDRPDPPAPPPADPAWAARNWGDLGAEERLTRQLRGERDAVTQDAERLRGELAAARDWAQEEAAAAAAERDALLGELARFRRLQGFSVRVAEAVQAARDRFPAAARLAKRAAGQG